MSYGTSMSISNVSSAREVWLAPVTFGCDPEFFIEHDGRIVGSEKAIPKAGLSYAEKLYCDPNGQGTFVQDGVQIELNPLPKACRGNLAMEMAAGFRILRDHLSKLDMKVSFRSVIEIDKAELDSLSEKAKLLGCAPSLNKYDKAATISINPATYRKRSAGGHIHLGLQEYLMPHRERLVSLLDVLLGNTCVLLDRDTSAAERRKVYGRAGEYRLPKHGLEYRTLSNFWLKSYQLMSFVFGMARLANSILTTTVGSVPDSLASDLKKWDAESALLNLVDLKAIREAINANNVELAKKNYEGVRMFIADHVSAMESGLDATNLDAFDYFIRGIDKGGLDYWFPEDILEHWCQFGMNTELKQVNTHGLGFESFMEKLHDLMCKEAAYEEYAVR
jgi:hypothetical protein